MSYGYAKPSGDYRSQGILSLLQNMAKPKGGSVSDKEMSYFMDKDTGTEHHVAKTGRKTLGAVSKREMEALSRGNLASKGYQFFDADKTTMDAYGNPIPDIDVHELTKKFSEILGSISPQEQLPVIKHWQHSDDDGKVLFMKHIVDNPELATGYGIQEETLIPNLGFSRY